MAAAWESAPIEGAAKPAKQPAWMAAPVEGAAAPEPTIGQQVKQGAGNLIAGAVRGAGSIGATILAPYDMVMDKIDPQTSITSLVTGKKTPSRNEQRRADMDAVLAEMGAEPDSLLYKGGKLGGEIAGTAGVGGTLAKGLQAIPAVAKYAPGVVEAVRTSGMTAGAAKAGISGTLANLGTRTLGGAVTGGASAALVNPEDAATGATIGALLPGSLALAGKAGKATGKTLGKVTRSVIGEASPEVVALAQKAKDLGIDIPADRLVNSKPLDAVASGLNYVPFSGRSATEAKMAEQLNKALSKTFGESSSNVTQALRSAETKLGGQFDSFLRANTVNVDEKFIADLAEASNQASRELGSEGASIIGKQVDDIIAKAGSGQIDGQAAYNIKKTLDRIGNRNSPEAWYAIDLKKKLMEALNRSVGEEKAAAFATLRQQYGNMLDLQKIAKNGAEGEISVARLANMKNINNQPLQDIADIAAQFVKPREGQHGAMQRAVVGMGTAATAGPVGLAVGAGTGRAVNSALNSQTLRNVALGAPSQPGRLSELLASPDLQQGLFRAAPVALSGR